MVVMIIQMTFFNRKSYFIERDYCHSGCEENNRNPGMLFNEIKHLIIRPHKFSKPRGGFQKGCITLKFGMRQIQEQSATLSAHIGASETLR